MGSSAEGKIRELLEVAKQYHLAEMAFQENGLRVAFRRNHYRREPVISKNSTNGNGKTKEAGTNATDTKEEIIRSPMVGTFRRSLSKDHPPMVVEGNHVKPGDKMGVVECMKIPNEVIAFGEGFVAKILVDEGQAVEYGQPLFALSSTKSSSNGNGRK